MWILVEIAAGNSAFIPCWPGYIINWIDDKWDAGHGTEGKAIWWFLHVPIVMIMAIIWMDAIYGKPEHWAQWVIDWGWYPIGIAVGIGLIVILILLGLTVVGCIYIKQWIDSKRNYSRAKNAVNKPNPLVEGWKAFKGKYCSKITWI